MGFIIRNPSSATSRLGAHRQVVMLAGPQFLIYRLRVGTRPASEVVGRFDGTMMTINNHTTAFYPFIKFHTPCPTTSQTCPLGSCPFLKLNTPNTKFTFPYHQPGSPPNSSGPLPDTPVLQNAYRQLSNYTNVFIATRTTVEMVVSILAASRLIGSNTQERAQ